MKAICVLALTALLLSGAIVADDTATPDVLVVVIDARYDDYDPGTKAGKKARNALEKARAWLVGPTSTVEDRLKASGKVAAVLDRTFPGDVEFGIHLDDRISGQRGEADSLRAKLAFLSGTLGSPKAENKLAKALQKYDALTVKADPKPTRAAMAKLLRKACRKITKTAGKLDIDLTEVVVIHDPVPDFALPDVNPTSPRFEEQVSPRDYLGQVSAWYFGHST